MPHYFSNKRLIILLTSIIVLVAMIGFSLKQRTELSLPEQFLKDAVGWTQTILYKPATSIAGLFKNVQEMNQMDHENKGLQSKLNEYNQISAENNELKKTNAALKAQFSNQESLTDYTIREASVIGRSPDNWNKFVFINKGSRDGIKADMAVISPQGFVGRVSKVAPFHSTVQLISDNDQSNRISAIVEGESRIFGTIEGFDTKKQALMFRQISIDGKIKKGQDVITSGLWEVFPRGLLIGKVTEVETDESGTTQTAYVKPSANLYDLDNLMVLDRKMQAVDVNLISKEGE